MNNQEIYSILGQGLNIANTKGCFNLDESATIAQALFQLKEVLNLVEKKDDSIKTAHPNAQEVTISTLLCGLKYAEPEAQRLLSIYDPTRIILTVSVKVDASSLSTVDLGTVVKITSSRYGLSSGKYLRVIGIQTDFENNKLDLKLWG